MFDVSADGEGGVLTTKELVFYATELKPWVFRCALVFVAFYKVPALELSASQTDICEFFALTLTKCSATSITAGPRKPIETSCHGIRPYLVLSSWFCFLEKVR